MSKPILAVDVDGVISLFGFEEPPPGQEARFELVDGMVHCISLGAGERLKRLGEHYELVGRRKPMTTCPTSSAFRSCRF